MLHKADPTRDFKRKALCDWTGLNEHCFVQSKFYKIADLEKNGFIHDEDGSLRFEFEIQKQNFRKKNEELK